MKETNTRSIVNAFSWRMIATCITVGIGYLFTGEVMGKLRETGYIDEAG